MSFKSNLIKAGAIGAFAIALSAGAAFAAVATGSVNVRTGPGTSYRAIDQLSPGERVSITDQSSGWCEVSRPGPNGWVSCAYLAQSDFDNGPRFRNFDRGPRFDRRHRNDYDPYFGESGVSFSFGVGTPGMHMHRSQWW